MSDVALEPESFRVPRTAYVVVFLGIALYAGAVVLDAAPLFFQLLLGLIVFAVGLARIEAALLFVPIAIMNPFPLKDTGTNLIVSEYILLIVFVLFLVRLLAAGRPLYFPRGFILPTALLLAAAAVSIAAARYTLPAVLQFVRILEVLAVFPFVIVNTVEDTRDIERMANVVLLGGILAALIGLGQFVTGSETFGEYRRVYGWLGGGFGAVVASTLLLALGILLYGRGTVARLLAAIAVPVAALALIVSQTRAWIAAFVIAAAVVVLRSTGSSRRRVLIIGGSVLLVALLFFFIGGFGVMKRGLVESAVENAFRFGPAGGARSVEDLSLLMRLNLWYRSLQQFIAHPITGIGIGNLRFDDMLSAHIGPPSPKAGFVDNQYLQEFVELGIFGGIAWILFIVRTMQLALRVTASSVGTPLHAIALGLLGCLLVFVVGSFFWVITMMHELFVMFALIIALLMCIERVTSTPGERAA